MADGRKSLFWREFNLADGAKKTLLIINQLIMERYKQIVTERYIEPKEEEIIGTFLHMDVIAEVSLEITPVEPKKKKKKLTNSNVTKLTSDLFLQERRKERTYLQRKPHWSTLIKTINQMMI